MLIDSNIFVEVAKKQSHREDCRDLLTAILMNQISEEIYITPFTLSTIQFMLGRIDKRLLKEVMTMIHLEKIKVVNFNPSEYLLIITALKDLNLDFDDAVQWTATNNLSTYIVTYDKDFENTGIEVKTPRQILKKVLK
jgi:predicted nucleic acid-binding protein